SAGSRMSLALPGAATVNVTNLAASIVISSNIAGASESLDKTGSGLLVLSGAKAYSGSTIVDGGTLQIPSGSSITSNNVSVAAGATLSVAGSISAATALSANGTVSLSSPSQTISSLKGSGSVVLAGALPTA